jgi:hypothetical protein
VPAFHRASGACCSCAVEGLPENHAVTLNVDADAVAAEEATMEACEDAAAPPAVDTFSDLDDDELDQYLATPEEAEVKKQIWTACNKCATARCML